LLAAFQEFSDNFSCFLQKFISYQSKRKPSSWKILEEPPLALKQAFRKNKLNLQNNIGQIIYNKLEWLWFSESGRYFLIEIENKQYFMEKFEERDGTVSFYLVANPANLDLIIKYKFLVKH